MRLRYIQELFPKATHTIDVFHVTEYLWKAGGCLYKEGSEELVEWVEDQKDLLYVRMIKINDGKMA